MPLIGEGSDSITPSREPPTLIQLLNYYHPITAIRQGTAMNFASLCGIKMHGSRCRTEAEKSEIPEDGSSGGRRIRSEVGVYSIWQLYVSS